MSNGSDTLTAMLDYVHQLKKHTEGRWAMHLKLSALERHMQEPYYRREVASALRPLVTGKSAKIFALPNADSVVVTGPANLDDIAPTVLDVRKKLKDSSFMGSYDPVIGRSDDFIEWFELEVEYEDFDIYCRELARKAAKKPSGQTVASSKKPVKAAPSAPEVVSDQPTAEPELRQLDAFVLAGAMRKMAWADVTSALKTQNTVAIVGEQEPAAVLVHKFVDVTQLLEDLTNVTVAEYDRWLEGYFAEEVATKLLDAQPDLSNAGSLASSIRLTCTAVLSASFERFNAGLSPAQRARIVIEFSLIDVLSHPRCYRAAYEKTESLGYKIALADVEPESLLWLDYEKLHASFIKLHKPKDVRADWLPHDLEQEINARISQIGRARVIFDGCDSEQDVLLGQQLGITLFQGPHFD
ncbi:MAG: hypothetical protein JJ850_06380 [Kordiimonadaceae bacterium]|nr:hypothetical protein [Kordiimonadaceae bacterium]MBO6568047.1 hypothetical protein [Kordiimonadaceae bacterium]MBO6964223.1 hypothetical protein [Kordiimonadaceae bacterium]